MMKRAY